MSIYSHHLASPGRPAFHTPAFQWPASHRPAFRSLCVLIPALLLLSLPVSLLGAAPAEARQSGDAARQAVSDTLDALHMAASEANFDRYFGLYAEDAVFYGTDATERWTRAEFESYAAPHFEAGRGWTYHMTERNVYVSEDGRFAWFDERLDNASLGETRGSGVLRLSERGWQVVQYNLTIPVPNELAGDFVRQIREIDTNR